MPAPSRSASWDALERDAAGERRPRPEHRGDAGAGERSDEGAAGTDGGQDTERDGRPVELVGDEHHEQAVAGREAEVVHDL